MEIFKEYVTVKQEKAKHYFLYYFKTMRLRSLIPWTFWAISSKFSSLTDIYAKKPIFLLFCIDSATSTGIDTSKGILKRSGSFFLSFFFLYMLFVFYPTIEERENTCIIRLIDHHHLKLKAEHEVTESLNRYVQHSAWISKQVQPNYVW